MSFGIYLVLIILIILGILLFLRITPKDQKSTYFKIASIGALGWLLAFVIRLIPLQIAQIATIIALGGSISSQASILKFSTNYAVLIWGPLFAGIFEECGRYIAFRYSSVTRQNTFKAPIIFGLGWGLGEAIVIFLLSGLATIGQTTGNPSISSYAASFLERVSAISIHILLSLVVINALYEGKFFHKISLFLAIFIHFIFDFTIVIWEASFANFKSNRPILWIWSVELTFLVMAILVGIFVLAYWLPKKSQMIKEGKMNLNIDGDQIRCKKCGSLIASGSTFCGNCGAEIA